MDKKALSAVAVIIALIVIGMSYIVFTKSGKQETATEPTTSQVTTETAPVPSSDNSAKSPVKGEYVTYSSALLQSAQGTRLLFFHAPWCPQCRELEASIKSNQLPDNLTIFKVDYDSNQALRQKYGVTLQTTVVKIDSTGNKVASYIAYDQPRFEAVKQALLQ